MVKGCNTSLKCGYVEQLVNADLVCTEMFQHEAWACGSWIFRSVSFDNALSWSWPPPQSAPLIKYRP